MRLTPSVKILLDMYSKLEKDDSVEEEELGDADTVHSLSAKGKTNTHTHNIASLDTVLLSRAISSQS